jgi:hydrogenase maturation protease
MIKIPSKGVRSLDQDNIDNVLVIGIGNEYRSDDGVGLAIARKIHGKHISSITVKEWSGEGAALVELWSGFKSVIIIDAVSSGAKPGTIFKFDACKEPVPAKFFHYSTHAFSIAEAIELARTMKMLPSSLFVYGIEGLNFTAGTNISKAVQNSADQIIEQILKTIKKSVSII